MLYTLFIITVELTIFLFIRPNNWRVRVRNPIQVSHNFIIILAGIAGISSYLLISEGLQKAFALNVPAYELMKRGLGEVSHLFTLHQVLNRVALVPVALGFAVLCSGKNPRLIAGRGGRWLIVGYLIFIVALLYLFFLLGYKSELFYSGLIGCLFYLANAERPQIALIIVAGFLVLTGMALTDLLRFVPLSELPDKLVHLQADELNIFKFATSSNEAFSPHFSMYGALAYDIPLTYGSSLLSLLASVIPRLLWLNRPQDIYSYYAESVNAMEGQGYAILHPTGWYLNFGVVGIVIGAVLLGFIWAKCFNGYLNLGGRQPRLYYIFGSLSPWILAAFIPQLMRAGPEIYKSLLVEGFLIPVTVLTLATYKLRLSPRRLKNASSPLRDK
jgi:hypothetical protein